MSDWRRPAHLGADLLLAAALLTAPLAWGSLQASGLALAACLVALAWALILAAGRPPGSLRLARTPLGPPVLALVAVAAASVAVSVSRFASWLEVCRLLVGAALFLALARPPLSLRRVQLVLGALALGGAATGWLAAQEYLVEWLTARNPVWRSFGTFITPNGLAGYLMIALPAGLVLAWISRSLAGRMVWGAATALMVAAFFLSGSRGGGLAFLPALLLFLLLAGHALARRRLAWALILAALGLTAVLAVAVTPLRVRLVGLLGGQDASMIFRYYVWQSALAQARDHPLLGTGAGTFELVYPRYAIAGFTRMAHQSYLQLAAEMGLPGLLAFLWLAAAFALGLRRAWRGWKPPPVRLVLAACAAGICGLFLHSLIDYGWYLGAIMLAAFGLLGVAAHLYPGEPAPPQAEPPPRRRRAPAPRPRALVVAVATLLAAGTLWQAASVAAADRCLERGAQAEAAGDYPAAREAYQQAVEARRDYPEALRKLARLCNLREGLFLARQAIAIEPTNAANYLLAARLYRQRSGNAAEARAWYQQALRHSPHLPSALRELGELYEQAGDYRQANACYEAIIALQAGPYGRYQALLSPETDFAYPHYWRARLLLAQPPSPELLARVQAELQAALQPLELAKQLPTVGHVLAVAATGRYQLPADLQELEARIRYRWSQVLAQLGQKEQAKVQREAALALAPQVPALVAAEPRPAW